MATGTNCRLTVLGPAKSLRALTARRVLRRFKARFPELLEHSKTRIAWQFETASSLLLIEVKALSRANPALTFLIEYEQEERRTKGLGICKRGKLSHCLLHY